MRELHVLHCCNSLFQLAQGHLHTINDDLHRADFTEAPLITAGCPKLCCKVTGIIPCSCQAPPARLTWNLYERLRPSGASEAGTGAFSAAGILLSESN